MTAINSIPELDKAIEFYQQIKEIEVLLYRPGIESEFPNESERQRFILDRMQWSLYVQRVALDIANVLLNKLAENSAEFEAGIQTIQAQIQQIEDTVGFLNILERVLVIVGQVVRLVM